ncbi:MAG: EAL domain-containing protein [Alphaproteobacteria bacterium]|nr:EAL domain-containing protein [Alphaproteobacteria bacterium]
MIWHFVIFACYTLAAATGAVVLVVSPLGFERATAGLFGLAAFLSAGLIHEILHRRAEARRALRRLNLLRKAYGQNRNELTQARDEIRRIYEALESAGQFESQRDSFGLSQVAAEVKVLHSLVDQLYSDQDSDASARKRVASTDLAVEERAEAALQLADATAKKFRSYNALDEGVILDIVREGLRRDRVDLYLQPIVSLPQRKQRFFECFSRIRAADGTMLLPDQYIETARASGLIRAIDNMLLFRCVQLLRRTERYNYATAFFCNVTPHSIGDRTFFEEFISYLENCPDLAPSLVFEFSQDEFELLGGDIAADMKRLSKSGYRFSLDQVSDMRFDVPALAARNFQFVKVDAAMILEQAKLNPEIVRATKQSLDDVGIDLIVEKIETEQMLAELSDFRIDFGQGYLFGEPRISQDPPEAFQELQVSE